MCRLSLLAVCAVLSLTPHGDRRGFLLLLPLALGAWAAYRSASFARGWPYAAAALCATAVPFTGGGRSALLPYLLASAFTVGLTCGVRELLIISGGTSGLLLAGPFVTDVGPRGDYLVGTAQWVLLALAVGLMPLWSRHLRLLPHASDDYVEVRRLLEQLRSLARHLPGSLDAPAAAEALLNRCRSVVQIDCAALIAQTTQDVLVPLAVLGVSRVPWRTPLQEDGPLRRAWQSGAPVRDTRKEDILGRRRGCVLLVLPLPSRHGPFGLVVLESSEAEAFPQHIIDELSAIVISAAPLLETSLMFEEIRAEASTQERDRLAREMHDGIAQELAVLGYQLDHLGQAAQRVDPTLAGDIGSLRSQLTALVSELRLSITDLRTTVHPARGIGAALSTYLPAVCSGRDIVLTLSLSESPFRLGADQEVALLKIAQSFAQEVRRTPGAGQLTVQLAVDPPSATLAMACDVPLPDMRSDEIRGLAASAGAEVALSITESGAPALTITLRGAEHDNPVAGGRSRTHPTRTAAGLRAD